jgi:hypothetical protein
MTRAQGANSLDNFNQPAQPAHKSHLFGRPTPGLEELGTADQTNQTLRSRGRDVEAVEAEEEVHTAGRIVDR